MVGFFALDSFFIFQGFFIVFFAFNLEKTNETVNLLMLYTHRYLRIVPTLGIGMILSHLVKFSFDAGPKITY